MQQASATGTYRKKDDEDGVINMKIHNPFIAALGVNSTSKCNITHNICKTPASMLKSSIFPWSSVYFLLYVRDLFVCEIIEVCLLWYVLPDEFVCIFNGSFLP